MEPGTAPDIFHRQGQARLVAGDGLVLGAVILKHAVNFLHAGAKEHVRQKDDQLEYALQNHLGPAGQRHHLPHRPREEGGQKGEQEQRQQHPRKGGAGHQHILHGGGGVLVQPLVKFGLVGLLFLLGEGDVRAVHQVLVAAVQVLGHVADAPHKGHFVVPVGGDRVIGQVDLTVRAAHRAADFLGAAHHDALHEGLPAHRGAETFRLGVVCHSNSFVYICSCRCSCPG